ncbi:hypothetical protein L198_07450 [Cryptococcus wingfieldii CBS 7118]|uniref:Uncharacterized protein n=1 Tax=Cryptococcus wingfieldii CBS 7118 TaxID=1295528 RepID=A0A1E3IBS8_9TREE|nr:hypothetical protein L198_07450 [Cryptococcus wingfieldii CBS 7118]ODN85885.1 hypothetical protein L198_07450 [Cryptococcus wingfieldii CBS 7118]
MAFSNSTSPSLGGLGSLPEDDVISLGSSDSSSSSASAETADPATPNLSPFEEADSGEKSVNKSVFPPAADQYGSSNDEEAAQDSETRSTRTDEMVDEAKLVEAFEEIGNFLERLESDWWASAKKEMNTSVKELLEQQSKRFEEAYNKVVQQETDIHRENTNGLITRVSQLEATLASLSNPQKQEVGRNQESTDGLVNRVAQLETTLANLTLQKTPPDIHVDVHMPSQQSTSTTADDAPPRRPPHDEDSSDGRPQSSLSLKDSLDWTAGLLMQMSYHYSSNGNIMRTFREARSMRQTNPSGCREKICELCGILEAFAARRRYPENRNPRDAWEEAVAMRAVELLKMAL